MLSSVDISAAHQQHSALLKEATVLNRTAVFDALETIGITTVTVTFDGEGDSGQIQEILARASDVQKPIPHTQIPWQIAAWKATELESGTLPLEQAIENICWNYLSDEHGGWENNDGGYGEFTLTVATRTVELEFNGRYTDVHTSFHTF